MADKTLKQYGKTRILPKTGQTISKADYDDGYYQKGSPASPRFVDNGDGTISDRATGLMWVKQPELIIPGASVIASNQIQIAHGDWVTSHAYIIGDLVYDTVGLKYYVCIVAHTSGTFADDLAAGKWIETIWTASAANLLTPSTMTWANALTFCHNLNYAGHIDWRMPNAMEGFSILDFSVSSPAINAISFPNTKTYYWTSSFSKNYEAEGYKWQVTYDRGMVQENTAGEDNVRPVRGGI